MTSPAFGHPLCVVLRHHHRDKVCWAPPIMCLREATCYALATDKTSPRRDRFVMSRGEVPRAWPPSRTEQVRALSNKMLRTPMEPFYVTGQRRVGKTSLAKAASRFAQGHEKGTGLRILYLLWGEVAHDDPRASLRALGTRIAQFVNSTLPTELRHHTPLSFEGSLAPLMELFAHVRHAAPTLKPARSVAQASCCVQSAALVERNVRRARPLI